MRISIGIDAGSTALKLVALPRGGATQPLVRFRGETALRETLALLRAALAERGLSLQDADIIGVTGVGAAQAADALRGCSVARIEEFDATARGALALSGEKRGMVVSMGTGTAFLLADVGGVRHLCGSGIGGGTLTGLCTGLSGVSRFAEICRRSRMGDLKKVDLTVGQVLTRVPPTLHPDMTVTNFGRVASGAGEDDLLAGAVNLVLQGIGTMALLACRSCGTDTAILTGSLTELPQAADCFQLFQRLYQTRFLIPAHAAYATAVGAALCAGDPPHASI